MIMNEKTIHLTSCDNTLSLTASINSRDGFSDIDIRGSIRFVLDKNEVLKAYIINDDMSKTNLGVINVEYDSLCLKKRIVTKDTYPRGIIITKKDTVTEKEDTVIKGSFCDDFTFDDLYRDCTDENQSPLNNARNILSKIKNASETKDQGISKRNCINMIEHNLEKMEYINHNFRMFERFYRVEKFFPIVNLSSLKYVMSEGLCSLSFFETGYYYVSLRENILLIAFKEYNGQNPIYHIKDFSFPIEISSERFFGTMIELADEGQYFIL